jgi:hypothetical protein
LTVNKTNMISNMLEFIYWSNVIVIFSFRGRGNSKNFV